MNKVLFYLFLIFNFTFANILIKGVVVDGSGKPIPYANIYIKDTFDGISSNDKGQFSFTTFESGNQTFVASFIGYEIFEKEILIESDDIFINVILEASASRIGEVSITAGTFGAGDDEKVIVLDPIDIVTVASARGEITGALEALPGTQPQSDQQGIYVRGGDASEAKQIVDGMLIQNPYFSDVPDIPQRGRFEPFDFRGTAFSQGGYSAQYGQALSAIVDLQTWTRFGDFNANTFGVTPLSLSYGRAYGNDSTICGTTIDYTNLKYFQDLNNDGLLSDFIKSRVNFSKPVEAIEIKTNYSKKFNKGIFKYLGRITQSSLSTSPSDIGSNFNLDNDNKFLLSTYKTEIDSSSNTILQLGYSYSDNEDDARIIFNNDNIVVGLPAYDKLNQFRIVLKRDIFKKSKIKFGSHIFNQKSRFKYYTIINPEDSQGWIENNINVNEVLSTSFAEIDLRISKKFAINTGIRFEDSELLNKNSLSPRFSSAYKLSRNSQISYAYGDFYQTPDMAFDKWYRSNNIVTDFNNSGLDFEHSRHHIFNYEYNKKKRTLRIELFKKTYNDLIIKDVIPNTCLNDQDICQYSLSNNGFGYSKGIELFWRSNQVKDGLGSDIWIAYSFLDSKRKFKQYYDNPIRPSFASEHKITFVYKNTFDLKKQKGRFNTSMAMTATSGFPYYDPYNNIQYTSKPYLSFDIGGSYLPEIDDGFLVVFFNISNPFGYRNNYGLEYVGYDLGQLENPKERLPSSLRSVFIGCFMFFSIEKNK